MTITQEPESSAEEALQETRRLTKCIVDAYEQRQQSVAEQIHERFAQKVFGALLHLQAFEHLDRDSEAATRTIGLVKEVLDDVIGEARRIVSQLRLPILDKFSIVDGIKYLICGMDGDPSREIEFRHSGRLTNLAPEVEIAVFRIVQELLAHACQRRRAKKIRVGLAQDNGFVRVEMQDWSVGFDPAETDERIFGLDGVRDRAELRGGSVNITSARGKGMRVVVELPLVDPDVTAVGNWHT